MQKSFIVTLLFILLAGDSHGSPNEEGSVSISECQKLSEMTFHKFAESLRMGKGLVSHLKFVKSYQDKESNNLIYVYDSDGIEDASGTIIYQSRLRIEMVVFEDGCEVASFHLDTGSKFME